MSKPPSFSAGLSVPAGREVLADLLSGVVTSNTVVLCVGSELRGDDGAGPAVAKALAGRVGWDVIDAGIAPENFLMAVASRQPECVLVIDALHTGRPPGSVRLLTPDEACAASPGTHGPGLSAVLTALQLACPCRCVVLGVQPATTEVGAMMSQPVREAAVEIAAAIEGLARSLASVGPIATGCPPD